MTNNIMVELRNALEPRKPYYALRFESDCDDVGVTVYNADTHEPTYEAQITESVAREMLEGAAHLSLDGDAVEFEQITAHLDRDRAPPASCSVADAVQFLFDALQREGGAVRVRIDGAEWLVTS